MTMLSATNSSLLKGKVSTSAAARKYQVGARKRKAASMALKNAKAPASFREPVVELQAPEVELPKTNMTVYRPIVFGSLAFALTPEQGYTEYKTHQWAFTYGGSSAKICRTSLNRLPFPSTQVLTPQFEPSRKPPLKLWNMGGVNSPSGSGLSFRILHWTRSTKFTC